MAALVNRDALGRALQGQPRKGEELTTIRAYLQQQRAIGLSEFQAMAEKPRLNAPQPSNLRTDLHGKPAEK
ncbi:MAG: hypothetical protein QM719_12925 [Thermomonas sp.]